MASSEAAKTSSDGDVSTVTPSGGATSTTTTPRPRLGDSVLIKADQRVGMISSQPEESESWWNDRHGVTFANGAVEVHAADAFTVVPPPLYLPATVISYCVALPGSFLVFTMYWVLVYQVDYCDEGGCKPPRALSCMTHGANFAVMLVDILICNQGWRLAHFAYIALYCLVYLAWTGLYYALGLYRRCSCPEPDDDASEGAFDDDNPHPGCKELGDDDKADECRYIYTSLNWAKGARGGTLALGMVIVLFVVPVVWLMFYALVFARRWLKERPEGASACCCVHCCGGGGRGDTGGGNKKAQRTLERTDTIHHYSVGGFRRLYRREFGAFCSRLSPRVEGWVQRFGESSFIKSRFPSSSPSSSSSFGEAVASSLDAFLACRAALFLFLFAVFLWSASEGTPNWPSYLTHWTLVVELVYLLLAVLATFEAQKVLRSSAARAAAVATGDAGDLQLLQVDSSNC